MKFLSIISIIFCFLACSSQEGTMSPGDKGEQEEDLTRWTIPKEDIFDGGPGKDGIPSIDEPKFVQGAAVDYLADSDLVIAVRFDTTIKVYPHSILDWHEIVNDELDGELYALTYCPLTGTGINWDRKRVGNTTFGVSGLLYNSNLIPYDRETNSNWSQMRLDCVNGTLVESKIKVLPVLETTWSTIKDLPNLMVLTTETGFSRNYSTYPYGDYRSNHNNVLFPVGNSDDRMKAKERVLGVIKDDLTKTYSLKSFSPDSIQMIADKLFTKSIIIVGNQKMNFISVYYVDEPQSFSTLQGQFPNILKDQNGNIYDIFGKISSGPDKGLVLEQPDNYMGYWFAWAAFYPDLELYD